MNDDAIYKAYCAKYLPIFGFNEDGSFDDNIRKYVSKTFDYIKFKYSIRPYSFYLVFRMPFIVAWVEIKRLFR